MAHEKLTTYSLEKRAGLKSNAVHNILSGRSKKPSINIIQAIAKALNCTVSDLIGEEPITAHSSYSVREEVKINEPGLFQNSELYVKCLSYFCSLLNKRKLWLSKSQILDCVDEIYLYSLKRGLNKAVDPHFAQWLIDKSQNKIFSGKISIIERGK